MLSIVLAGILLASLAGNLGARSVRAQLDTASEDRVARATVLIVALVLELENGIRMREHRRVPLGSGILVSADGLILTNSHVIDLTNLQSDIETEENTQGIDLEIEDGFLIYVVDGMDDSPDPRYSATIVIDQQSLDLAVLSVSGNERGLELSQPVGADRAPVVLSPSGAVSSRDQVQIFGYPVFGSDSFTDPGSTTIDVVDGRVRSLETGPGIGNIERIHIDATVSGGSSGGAVVDEHGRLVGVVAEALSGAAGGSAAVAIPVNRARTILSAAGWVEPPPTSAPTPVDTPEPTATTSRAEETPVPPTPTPTPTTAPTAEDPEDAARFAELLAAREGISPIAGPTTGEITQALGYVAAAGASLTTADFSASATFANPERLSGLQWDLGFAFHLTADVAQQIVVDSNGNWYYVPYPEGTLASGVVPGFDSNPGGVNTLDLMVEGNTALFGVNGQFVTRLDLPPAIPSDVQVGSGFFTTTVEEGRTIAYTDFAVWALSGSDSPASTSTPLPAGTPAAETPAATGDDTDLASRFIDLLDARAGTQPLAGPISGEIIQDDDFIAIAEAGLTTADFSASVTFVNPSQLSGASWDFGMAFHRTAASSQQLAVDSNGGWYFLPQPEGSAASGTVPAFNSNPGATNTLDLMVEGNSALFGVNGQFVAQLDLSPAIPSDVQIGSGYFTSTTEHGRAIAFRDFMVWPIAAPALELATSTPIPATSTPVPATSTPLPTVPPIETPASPIDPISALRFHALLRESEGLSDVGPFSGTLQEVTAGQVQLVNAGVDLTNFGASVTFTNPDTSVADADIGFEFRVSDDGTEWNWIVVDSLGAVFARLAGAEWQVAGIPTSYDTTAGAANTLQVFVEDNEALIGVNDQFVAALDLPAEPVASDVSIGSAFFVVDFVQDRVTRFEDFRVWELPADGTAATTTLAAPVSTLIASESTPFPSASTPTP